MKALESFNLGELDTAVSEATAEVKKNPTDLNRRNLLCELLCYENQLERVDKQLETLMIQQPESSITVSLFRQLIRAELTRQECFSEGRSPELLQEPDDLIRKQVQLWLARREGDTESIKQLVADIDEMRPPVSGVCNGKPFEDMRDMNDFTSFFFEVLTSTGKYYWVPMSQVETLEIHRPKRPRELMWIQASMVVRDGPDGEVYLPTMYCGTNQSNDKQLKLGRSTTWVGDEPGPMQGLGRRMFWIGETDISLLEIETIEFNQPS
jgi:type VI secretion system protein ImpE